MLKVPNSGLRYSNFFPTSACLYDNEGLPLYESLSVVSHRAYGNVNLNIAQLTLRTLPIKDITLDKLVSLSDSLNYNVGKFLFENPAFLNISWAYEKTPCASDPRVGELMATPIHLLGTLWKDQYGVFYTTAFQYIKKSGKPWLLRIVPLPKTSLFSSIRYLALTQ